MKAEGAPTTDGRIEVIGRGSPSSCEIKRDTKKKVQLWCELGSQPKDAGGYFHARGNTSSLQTGSRPNNRTTKPNAFIPNNPVPYENTGLPGLYTRPIK